MEPQKLGNSPGPGPEVVKRQIVAKEEGAKRVHSWTVREVSAGAAGRALNSASPREIRT